MAHDKQYKDAMPGMQIKWFDCPRKGEWYWDRYRHRVVRADRDIEEKFLIVERSRK